jgi:hypothetical protein
VGFRIIGRNPKALDWVIIQNTNAYENGFTPAWDGFRKALWVNRTPESEAPLAGFNTPETIKNVVYLGGSAHPELIAPESYETDAASVAGPTNLRIQAEVPAGSSAEDSDLLGRARPVLHPRRRRVVPQRPPEGGNPPPERRSLRDRGQPALHRRPHGQLLRRAS